MKSPVIVLLLASLFDVFESLPRQGPGNRVSAEKALGLCRELPASPSILDLGCGSGGQTLHLADLSPGSILAIDSHAPGIERLQAAIAELPDEAWWDDFQAPMEARIATFRVP
ncbi:MAG: class I SAM-dependent methyltransferase [Rhodothermales bacterium]|nr:class I SAM-dependent methyltransferase [Rhodothermales bacterium]